jgi:hypothetical protein
MTFLFSSLLSKYFWQEISNLEARLRYPDRAKASASTIEGAKTPLTANEHKQMHLSIKK